MIAELVCLALAVYYEARSEPLASQLAVAQVVMQRTESDRYPDEVCAVVKQGPTASNGILLRDRCQFSFWCDGRGETPRERRAWWRAMAVAAAAYIGIRDPRIATALHYHAVKVRPDWATEPVAVLGSHAFYSGVR